MTDRNDEIHWRGVCLRCGKTQAAAIERPGPKGVLDAVRACTHASLRVERVAPGDAGYPVTMDADCGCWKRGKWVETAAMDAPAAQPGLFPEVPA